MTKATRFVTVLVVFSATALMILFMPTLTLSKDVDAEDAAASIQQQTSGVQETSAATPQAFCRFGVNPVRRAIDDYPISDLASLRAGNYNKWSVSVDPVTPNGMEAIQMVRVKQWKENPSTGELVRISYTAPYAEPYTYTIRPGWSTIRQAVENNPGSVWLIGNEIERRDWATSSGVPGGQDEILPEVYAWAYHDLYTFIKKWDPSARVSAGGIIQATPLRLEYMDRMWAEYQRRYGTEMPVDVWNIHAFILQEVRGSWGADIPAGIDQETGKLYSADDNKDFSIAAEHIRAFREWMREKGEQNKPLYISEYSVNMPWYSAEEVRDSFMYPSFDFYLHEKDTSLGYPRDDYRLVQKWLWYSLDDDTKCGDSTCYNGYLFYSGINPDHPVSVMSPLGQQWEAYVNDPNNVPAKTDVAPLGVSQDKSYSAATAPVTVDLEVRIANSGHINAAPFTLEVWDEDKGTLIDTTTVESGVDGCGETATATLTWPNVGPGIHRVLVKADPSDQLLELDEGNNTIRGYVAVGVNRTFLPRVFGD